MSGDRPLSTNEGSSPEDEQLSQLVGEFEKALVDGIPTETLEQRIIHDFGSRAASALQGLKWLRAFESSEADTSEISSPLDQAATLPAGSPWMFGRFQVLERLGAGGHGIVFRVFDSKLNRDAALKVPRPDIHWQPGLDRRFLKEAKAAASLDHLHVLPVYDAGQIDGVNFILSAYCSGPNLAQWLAEQKKLNKPISPRLAARWLMHIADGIDYSHSKGVVHRDLKPANIMLEPTTPRRVAGSDEEAYRVRISDFGLSKSDDQDNSETVSNAILGTLAYMAPEQAQGGLNANVFSFDIYALGAILFEMLTGRPPLVGQNQIDLLRRIGLEDPPLPSSLRPNMPRDLEAICMKCLDRDPSRRYRTARDLSHDMSCFLAGEKVAARKVHRAYQYWKAAIGHRLPAWTSVGIAGSLAIICAAFGWQYFGANAERETLVQTISDVRTALAKERSDSESQSIAATSQEKALDEIYLSDMQRANRIWQESRVLERDAPFAAADIKELLMRHVPIPGTLDRRGFEWYYLWRCCEPERFVTPSRRVGNFVGHTNDVYAVEFTPDAKTLVTAGGDKTIRVWDVEDQKLQRTLIGHTADVNGIALSGDGKLLASASDDGTVRIWSVESGLERHTFTGHQSSVVAVAYHVRLPMVCSSDHDGVIKVWDVEQKSEIRSFRAHSKRIESLYRFPVESERGPDELLKFISSSEDNTAKIWSLGQTNEKRLLPARTFEYDYPLELFRMGHTSPVLATLGHLHTDISKVQFFRAENANRFAVESPPLLTGGFTVDDSQFLIAGWDTPIRAVDLATRKTWNVTEPLTVWSLAASRDGRHFAVGEKGGNVSLWDCSQTPHHTILP